MKNNRFGLVAGLALAAVLAASCGAPSLKPTGVATITFPLTPQVKLVGQGPLIPPIVPGPKGLILLASKRGFLQAFDPANAEKKSALWKYYVKKADVAPVVSEGRIIWAASDGRVFRLDESGKVVWTITLGAPVLGEMAVVETEVVFREGEKVLSALDPEKGDILWRTEEYAVADWMAEKDRIVIRTVDNRFKVARPDGKLSRDVPMEETAVGSFGLGGDCVYTGIADGRFASYDLAKGKKRWAIRLGANPIGRPVSDGKCVYVVLSSQVLAALDARRGHLLWWKPLSGRGAFTPRIFGDFVFVSSQSDQLQGFTKKTGEVEIVFTATREIAASVEVVGTFLYVASNYVVENYLLLQNFDLAPPPAADAVPAK